MEEQHALPTHHIQPTKPAMKKQSLFSLIKKYPLQIILFFIVSITSGVLLANNEAKSTANWETFDSKEAGVSFKHPKLFKVIEDKGWRITAYLSEKNPENNVKILYSHTATTIDQPTIEEQFLASCQAKRVSEIAAQGGRIKVYEDSTCGNQVVENSVLVYADNGMTYDIGLFGKIDRPKLYQFLSTFQFEQVASSVTPTRLPSQAQSISTTPEMTICTMDAKICSDGTTVGRTGPKCEFTCPDGTVTR